MSIKKSFKALSYYLQILWFMVLKIRSLSGMQEKKKEYRWKHQTIFIAEFNRPQDLFHLATEM